MTERPLVTFCMEWIPSYREGFYELLFDRLERAGIEMHVVHGLPPASRRQRKDHAEPEWGELVESREWTVRGIELTWQPVWRQARRSDLVIVQQEAALLFNYLALAHRRLGGPKVAMWGHGEFTDLTQQNGLAERVKRSATPLADWFFAYTEKSAEIVRGFGMDPGHITVVNNSRPGDDADWEDDDVDPEIAGLVAAAVERGSTIGWMSSALDTSKRLDVLIETLDALHSHRPDVEFFVLGRGPEDHVVFDAAEDRPWLHAVGARFGATKAAIGGAATFVLHPGLLGLHVIDSFHYRTPIVTSDGPWHSHEFGYLDASNSVVLPEGATAGDLAAAIADLLDDESRLEALRTGCADAADTYSIEKMVESFATGIVRALGRPA